MLELLVAQTVGAQAGAAATAATASAAASATFASMAAAAAWDIGVSMSLSAGMNTLAESLSGGPLRHTSMPRFSTYPIGNSQKGIPIPKIYGTCRVSGNIIWMGDATSFIVRHKTGHVHTGFFGSNVKRTYAEETRYRRSFAIAICEGPACIRRAWIGKDEISIDGFTQYQGNGTNRLTAQTGEDYGDYPNTLIAWFDEYDIGNSDAIPNFVFEVTSGEAYKYTWISETDGTLWGIPIVGRTLLCLDAGGAAVNAGGGLVQLPYAGNPFVEGDVVNIQGTTNYNGSHTLTSGTTSSVLEFSAAFVAETFDGTETVMRTQTGITNLTGRFIQDSSGNLYQGTDWNAGDGTYVYKLPVGGHTWVPVTLSGSWPVPSFNSSCYDVLLSSDEQYIYLAIYGSGPTDYAHCEKFELSTGNNVWSKQLAFAWPAPTIIHLDSDNNVYWAAGEIYKFDADDGTMTIINTTAEASNEFLLDEDIGLFVTGDFDRANWNLWAITTDGLTEDNYTPDLGVIGQQCVTTHNGYIYVLIHGTAIYKFSWSGTELVLEGSVAAPTYACGMYWDLWGNLVVINNKDPGEADAGMYFYDANLTYLSKTTQPFNTGWLAHWWLGAGTYWNKGRVAFYPTGAACKVCDLNPADIIYDLLTNTRYGAGIDPNYIDDDSFEICHDYWEAQSCLLSLCLDEQRPVVDWIDYVLLHCNGYRYWSGGKLHLGVFKSDTPTFTVTADDLVFEEGQPPMQVSKRPYSDTWNRVEVAWTDRENNYDGAVAIIQDEVDQRVCGAVRRRTVDLMGITDPDLAQQQAHRLLIDSMYRFSIYNFKLGYKSMLFEVGDVGTISDGHLITNQQVRIIGVNEDKDGRVLEVTAVEDVTRLYPDLSAWHTQENLRTPEAAITLADSTISYREDLDERALYLSISPGNAYCNGWSIYISLDGTNYEYMGDAVIDGVTNGDANAVGTLQSKLDSAPAVVHRYDEAITVSIGTVTDLKTSITDGQFFGNLSLAKIGDEIIGFKTAVETGTPGTWTVSQLMRGLFGTDPVEHLPGETFATLNIDFIHVFNYSDIGATLYVKALAFYGDEGQELADVTATQIEVQGYCNRPASACAIRLASDENDGGFDDYSGASFSAYWNLCAKDSGFGVGPADYGGTPWVYGDSESLLVNYGGVLFGSYTQDAELAAVDLVFEKTDGTVIGQRSIAVGSSETIVKASDLGGFNPAKVKVLPRRALRTWRENALQVDDGS